MEVVGSLNIVLLKSVKFSVSSGILVDLINEFVLSLTKVVSISVLFSVKWVVINFSSVNIVLSVNIVFISLCGFIKLDSWI